MQLVEFLQDFQGWKTGRCQYFTEEEAGRLIESGLAKDPYKKTIIEKVVTAVTPDEKENKAPEKPKKDKMIRSPVKKK